MGAVPVFVGGPDTLGPGLVPFAGYPALAVERHRVSSWMGSMHFPMKTLKHVDTEIALHVLAYNMKLMMHMLGVAGLMEAIRI
jgi:hypothetical protein